MAKTKLTRLIAGVNISTFRLGRTHQIAGSRAISALEEILKKIHGSMKPSRGLGVYLAK
jgi:hypothetical protein